MPKRALITGVTGQDGSYLAELLIAKGYEVHGLRRRSSTFGTQRIEHLIFDGQPQLHLHYGDLSDGNGLARLIREIQPHKVYNLAAQRDWGFACDYVEAMWLMLRQDVAEDYVIAMNELYSVREFCEKTFSRLDLDYRDFVEIDPCSYRPAEVDLLLGDSTKARTRLGWQPRTNIEQLIDMMVKSDLWLARQEAILKGMSASGRKAA